MLVTDRIATLGPASNAPGAGSYTGQDIVDMVHGQAKTGLLGKLIGANMNATTDQAIALVSAKCRIDRIVITNASISLDTAVGGFYNAAAKGGVAIVANTQVYSALTAAGKFIKAALAATAGGATTDVQSTLIFALTTAQGAAATADIYVFGEDLS